MERLDIMDILQLDAEQSAALAGLIGDLDLELTDVNGTDAVRCA